MQALSPAIDFMTERFGKPTELALDSGLDEGPLVEWVEAFRVIQARTPCQCKCRLTALYCEDRHTVLESNFNRHISLMMHHPCKSACAPSCSKHSPLAEHEPSSSLGDGCLKHSATGAIGSTIPPGAMLDYMLFSPALAGGGAGLPLACHSRSSNCGRVRASQCLYDPSCKSQAACGDAVGQLS